MNCKNCNQTLHIVHIGEWCLDCIAKLVERENAARAQGWAFSFEAWATYGKVAILGKSEPPWRALENAFKAGFAARGLPDPSRHGLPPLGDTDVGSVRNMVAPIISYEGTPPRKSESSDPFQGTTQCGAVCEVLRCPQAPSPHECGLISGHQSAHWFGVGHPCNPTKNLQP